MSKRGFAGVGLFNTKCHHNVGAALRASQCYNADFLATTGKRYTKSKLDTGVFSKHLPLFQVSDLKEIIPFDCIPIAVDLIEGATPIHEFEHPERAFYIFGPEDGTLGKNITKFCKHTIYIPTTFCMNLAATVNVVLFDRMMKRKEFGE